MPLIIGDKMKLVLSFLILVFSLSTYASDQKCAAIIKNNICIELEWTQNVELGTYLENIVRFKDLGQTDANQTVYVDLDEPIKFYGWMIMQHHEHGTRPVTTEKVSPGLYKNSKIFFMKGMKGKWQFKVRIGNEDFVLYSIDV